MLLVEINTRWGNAYRHPKVDKSRLLHLLLQYIALGLAQAQIIKIFLPLS